MKACWQWTSLAHIRQFDFSIGSAVAPLLSSEPSGIAASCPRAVRVSSRDVCAAVSHAPRAFRAHKTCAQGRATLRVVHAPFRLRSKSRASRATPHWIQVCVFTPLCTRTSMCKSLVVFTLRLICQNLWVILLI